MGGFCAPVRAWWEKSFQEMTSPQRMAVPAIAAGRNVLVCAPTGSGKTLCAFISMLSDLFERHLRGELSVGVDTVYISPLRALGTDVTRNLVRPLSEIGKELNDEGESPTAFDAIRVGQRTGDTSPKERARMLRRPPHILVTTPESLALCLANKGMREHLRGVRRIIIDELHSVASNKRGVDLMLSVERLSDFVMRNGGADPQRIGLSATIAPLDRMAAYLVGSGDGSGFERDCAIADASFDRPLELEIASVFGKTPFITTAAINRGVYDTLEKIIREHRTTLIFTNLRAATERVTYALRKRFAAGLEKGTYAEMIAPDHIAAHHSSLDRDVRLEIEEKLKAGTLRCVVCSTSLELGIDIGSIDRVVLLNSPKGVARGLQRVGRSGHRLNAVARGTFLPTVPADLIESIVTAQAMRKRDVDAIRMPSGSLDVLAQHLIGMTVQAGDEGVHTELAFAIVKRTWTYAGLTRETFGEVVHYVATEELRDTARVGAKLWLERDEGEVSEPRPSGSGFADRDGSRQPLPDGRGSDGTSWSGILRPLRKGITGLYAQNVGTITQEGQVKVKLREGAQVGTVEEAFAQILKKGDRFILGGRCVQFVGAKGMTVEVEESSGQMPTVPRWYSGTMSMEAGLAVRMRGFRGKVRDVAGGGERAIVGLLARQFGVNETIARPAAMYLHAQHRYAEIPVEGHLLIERVPDEEATVLVFHTMIGRAANEALARVLAYRMHKRLGGDATVVVDDYAFGVWVRQSTAARRADRTLVRSLLSAENFDVDLTAAVEASDLFRTQFRYTAIRAHAVLQNKFGRRRFIGQVQSYATKLYEALKEFHPDHLLLREARRTVMEDILHASGARDYLVQAAKEPMRLIDLATPSPFAFGLFATGKRDTLQLADTADFLLAMYEQVQKRIGGSTMKDRASQETLFV